MAYCSAPSAAAPWPVRSVCRGSRASLVLIGSSRHGALYHMIKGHFQRRLEAILPPEIPVEVIRPDPHPELFGAEGTDDTQEHAEVH